MSEWKVQTKLLDKKTLLTFDDILVRFSHAMISIAVSNAALDKNLKNRMTEEDLFNTIKTELQDELMSLIIHRFREIFKEEIELAKKNVNYIPGLSLSKKSGIPILLWYDVTTNDFRNEK